jgi:hypothetical protein
VYDDLGRPTSDTVSGAGGVGSNGAVTAPVYGSGYGAGWSPNGTDYALTTGGNPGSMLSRAATPAWDGFSLNYTGTSSSGYRTVSFDVRTSETATVGVAHSASDASYSTPSGRQVAATTTWQRYTCSFPAVSATATGWQLGFYRAGTSGTLSIDNVEVGTGAQPVDTCQLATTGSGTLSKRAYTYNPDSTVQTTTITQPGNPAAGLYQYTYDRGARLRSMTAPNAAVTGFTYDAAGNRLTAGSASYFYDQRNRLMSGAGTTYNWTPRCTLASTTGTGAATYAHDGLDRLTQVGTVTYSYDSLDRVTTRTLAGTATGFSYTGT